MEHPISDSIIERTEGCPVTVQILGVIHTIDQVTAILPRLETSDCVMVEYVGKAPEERRELLELLNSISEGQCDDTEIEDMLDASDDFALHLVSGLRGLGKLILLIDTPEKPDDEVWQLIQREKQQEAELTKAKDGSPLEQFQGVIALEQTVSLVDGLRVQRMARQITGYTKRLHQMNQSTAPPMVTAVVGLGHGAELVRALQTSV